MELEVLFHAVNVVENVVDDSRNDALKVRITNDSFHGVGLARGGLAIGKNGSIVSHEHILDNTPGSLIVNLLLAGVGLEDFVENVDFALRKRGDKGVSVQEQSLRNPTTHPQVDTVFRRARRELGYKTRARFFFGVVERSEATDYADAVLAGWLSLGRCC